MSIICWLSLPKVAKCHQMAPIAKEGDGCIDRFGSLNGAKLKRAKSKAKEL